MPLHSLKFIDIEGRVLGRRLGNYFASCELLLQLYKSGVRERHPEESEYQVLCRVAAKHLPRDLVIRAYGWDPDSGDPPPRENPQSHPSAND